MNRSALYENIIDIQLAPSTYDASKCDFRKHLDKIFDVYLNILDALDENERPDGWNSTMKEINELIDAIKVSVKLYYEGCHSKAFRKLSRHINNWLVTMLDAYYFYRMRMFEEGEKHDRNGMFHIPFNKRTIVKTQRYSAPGYPCLYLGTSAYICWEEMLRPNLDKCYVSLFWIGRPIAVFDLSLPAKPRWEDIDDPQKADNTFLFDLLRLPLVLACMVKVAKPKDPFKPEYIIPQLLMEWVIEKRKTRHQFDIIGIAYTSVHKSNDFKFAPEKSINVAIPAYSPFEGNYSKELCKMFDVTEPTCDELERAKCPYQAIERDEKISDLEYSYRISTFGQLEDRLKDETKFPLKKVRNVTKTDIYSKEVLFE